MMTLHGYHAHIYFEPEQRDQAFALRTQLAEALPVTLGNWNERVVGPHPRWSAEIIFPEALFGQVLSWLWRNRGGLIVLVHPLTERGDRVDHSAHAIWLGRSLPLHLEALSS